MLVLSQRRIGGEGAGVEVPLVGGDLVKSVSGGDLVTCTGEPARATGSFLSTPYVEGGVGAILRAPLAKLANFVSFV